MIKIAIKMLTGEKIRYFTIIGSIILSTMLIIMQLGLFCGMMRLTSVYVLNNPASIWVINSLVSRATGLTAMNDADLYLIKSLKGVSWALPFFQMKLTANVATGEFTDIDLMGVDEQTLFGIPSKIIKGNILDLYQSNSIVLDENTIERFVKMNIHLSIGDTLIINDHQLKIVAIVRGDPPVFTSPAVYTTFKRAIEIAPQQRKMLSAILVAPQKDITEEELISLINEKTALKAYTSSQFVLKTIFWYLSYSMIPSTVLIAAFLSLIVGLVVASNAFSSFIHEYREEIAALRAIGVSNMLLSKMVYSQIFICIVSGFFPGSGLASFIGWIIDNQKLSPVIFTWHVYIIVFALIFATLTNVARREIKKIIGSKPAEVFRG